jgi:hypothetical protein
VNLLEQKRNIALKAPALDLLSDNARFISSDLEIFVGGVPFSKASTSTWLRSNPFLVCNGVFASCLSNYDILVFGTAKGLLARIGNMASHCAIHDIAPGYFQCRAARGYRVG